MIFWMNVALKINDAELLPFVIRGSKGILHYLACTAEIIARLPTVGKAGRLQLRPQLDYLQSN